MNEWLAALSPVTFLGLLIAIGYAAEKTKYVPGLNRSISRLITGILLPALVVVSLSDQDVRQVSAYEILGVLLVGVVVIGLLLAVNYGVGKLLHIPPKRRHIHACLGSFGNVIFLAYPFIFQVLGSRGLLYAILFSVSNDLLLWSAGVYLLIRGSREDDAKWSVAYLLNPNTISFCVGMLLFVFRIRLPALLHAPLERLGAATVPLSMLFIGSTLAAAKLKEAVKGGAVWSIVLIKMIAAPLLFVLVVRLVGIQLSLDKLMLSAVALQIAMPSQTNLAVIADRYGADSEYAAQVIFVTTLASVVTLPALYFICQGM